MPKPKQPREYLKHAGLTVAEAARRADVQANYLTMILNRQRTPTLGKALRISRVTGIPLELLIGGEAL